MLQILIPLMVATITVLVAFLVERFVISKSNRSIDNAVASKYCKTNDPSAQNSSMGCMSFRVGKGCVAPRENVLKRTLQLYTYSEPTVWMNAISNGFHEDVPSVSNMTLEKENTYIYPCMVRLFDVPVDMTLSAIITIFSAQPKLDRDFDVEMRGDMRTLQALASMKNVTKVMEPSMNAITSLVSIMEKSEATMSQESFDKSTGPVAALFSSESITLRDIISNAGQGLDLMIPNATHGNCHMLKKVN